MSESASLLTGRNHGIDMLRVVSMFLVTVLHVMGQGGILYASQGWDYDVAWALEIGAYCAVDCFALISGFVMSRSPYRPSRIVSFWFQVFFYSLSIELISCVARGSVNLPELLQYTLPILYIKYWYATAYFGLLLLMPFLNITLKRLTRRGLGLLCGILVVFFSLITPFWGEIFFTNGGYSLIWLAVLYVLGWFFGAYREDIRVRPRTLWLAIAVSLTASFVCTVYFFNNVLVSYVSPTILVTAISLLLLFSGWRPGGAAVRFAGAMSPVCFGVYLIHVHPTVMQDILYQRFVPLTQRNAAVMALCALGIALVIFAVCAGIDALRLMLFRHLGVDRLCKIIDRKLAPLYASIERE